MHAIPCGNESAGAHQVSVGEQDPLGAQRTVLGGLDAHVVLVGDVQHHCGTLALCEALRASAAVGARVLRPGRECCVRRMDAAKILHARVLSHSMETRQANRQEVDQGVGDMERRYWGLTTACGLRSAAAASILPKLS